MDQPSNRVATTRPEHRRGMTRAQVREERRARSNRRKQRRRTVLIALGSVFAIMIIFALVFQQGFISRDHQLAGERGPYNAGGPGTRKIPTMAELTSRTPSFPKLVTASIPQRPARTGTRSAAKPTTMSALPPDGDLMSVLYPTKPWYTTWNTAVSVCTMTPTSARPTPAQRSPQR